jgi:hypothetical protein
MQGLILGPVFYAIFVSPMFVNEEHYLWMAPTFQDQTKIVPYLYIGHGKITESHH